MARLLVLSAVSTFFFVACAYFSYLSHTGGPKVAAFFLAFVLLGCDLLIEYFVARYEVRQDGLRYRECSAGAAWRAGRTSSPCSTRTGPPSAWS